MYLDKKDIEYIVVHCSGSPNGKAGDQFVTTETIHQWHLDRGWDGIGYHYIIERTGDEVQGRPLFWQGAHVAGYNSRSIGICLVGLDTFTVAQLDTLNALLDYLTKYIFKDQEVKIVGHYELNSNKTCPTFNPRKLMSTGNVTPE